MDSKDIIDVGSDIMNAVDDAVNRGDFSGLNETLRNVTGAAAGTAADALHGLQEHLQGGDGNGGPSGGGQGYPAGGPQQERTYGHAGRSSGNLTEEYMNRAPGARHHTRYTSRISPFLQRKVSRSGGIGKIRVSYREEVCRQQPVEMLHRVSVQLPVSLQDHHLRHGIARHGADGAGDALLIGPP